jgi:hypothetical protein
VECDTLAPVVRGTVPACAPWAEPIPWPSSTSRPRHRGVTLSDPTADSVPAELAPFLASARTNLEAATDGLKPHEAIEHLETTLARAEFEASRLGMRFDQFGVEAEALNTDGSGPVVVIRRLVDPDAQS